MNALFASPGFRREMPGWVIRGVICALNSVYFAVIASFQSVPEFAGMVTGVLIWAALFAAACAWFPSSRRFHGHRIDEALRWAVWLKVGMTVAGWSLVGISEFLGLQGWGDLGMVGTLDTIIGLVSLWLVGLIAGLKDPALIASLDSWGWTTVVTVVDGALMAVVISSLAVVVLGWWRLPAAISRIWKISPAPKAD
jgi:hypothetical protein